MKESTRRKVKSRSGVPQNQGRRGAGRPLQAVKRQEMIHYAWSKEEEEERKKHGY